MVKSPAPSTLTVPACLLVQARATEGTDPCSVLPGSYVTVVLAGVPAAAAEQLAAAVNAAAAGVPGTGASSSGAHAPPVAFGLMQHETKLTVVHFSARKVGMLQGSCGEGANPNPGCSDAAAAPACPAAAHQLTREGLACACRLLATPTMC